MFDALLDAGLTVIDSTADDDLVRTVGLTWTLDDDILSLGAAAPPRLAGARDTSPPRPLLRLRRDQVDGDWLAAASTTPPVVVAAVDLGLQRGDSNRVVLHRMEQAIRRGDLIGARVDLQMHDDLAGALPNRRTPSTATAAGATTARTQGGTTRHAADAAAAIGLGGATVGTAAPGAATSPRSRLASVGAGRLATLGVASLVVVAMVGQAIAGEDPTITPPRPLATAAPTAPDATETPVVDVTEEPSPFPTYPAEPASWVVAGPDGAPMRTQADGEVTETAAAGLTWPIIDEVDGGYIVTTHCGRDGWVDADDVVRPEVGRGDGMAGAVIALDAGHGGIDAGAVGTNGLTESELNLSVVERLQAMLERGNTIDPDSGAVTEGRDVPPVAAVVMTRDEQDAKQGDQRTSLVFRGDLATGADADAMLSVHHNSGGVRTFDEPATEVYYSVDDDASPRLAGLVLEELRRSLAPLETVWGGNTTDGAIGRRGSDGDDYYTVLEQTRGPAVISEALYLSGPRGAELAATDEFQQAEAEALYRALVRFLATEDVAEEEVDNPTIHDIGGSGAYDYSSCSLAVEDDA
ncbi:MAG TPA: N-acetylmuramoyl-L-alanine amidase [Nitriliruptoraceae bacterium]|nr:N-acetylmuramoyl-L-alanine amidase [Nitriliruptoraceae bacterium]